MNLKEIAAKIRKTILSLILHLVSKWVVLVAAVGFFVGSASALFLTLLDTATNFREENFWIISLLPLAGLVIGMAYYYLGSDVVKGNNQLFEEVENPKQVIPFKMAPLVLLGTVVTHLFGGSAGREGTAVQMGGAIADQFTHLFKLQPKDRKLLITIGISAGFASVFGTPLAGTAFALEVLLLGKLRYEAILPAFFAAVIADYTCTAWGIVHTHYSIVQTPELNLTHVGCSILVGILFGLTAMLFTKSIHLFTDLFKKTINCPPLRPLVGGIVIAAVVFATGATKYVGLGLPTIVASFSSSMEWYDFLLKILFTAFTLGAGFKGGEVTPLFYVGATLGNILVWIVPLPMSLLAGMGFVAVFAGATNTPIACVIMGIELFGIEGGAYFSIACVTAYFFSGHTGIYSVQHKTGPKHLLYAKIQSVTKSKQPNTSAEK